MISLLAALVISQTGTGEPCYRVPRAGHGCGMRATGRSGSSPFFEFAPVSGTGLPLTACSATAPTGTRGETITTTRSTVGECYSNDGQTLTQLAVNKARVSSGDGTSWMGLWEEGASQNDLWPSRDLSNAQWVKTNMTCTKTATGMRSDANAASTCTATAANATVCQTVTTAAAQRTSSWHLKRRTGTGAVTLARDGATYSSDISSRMSSTLWRRAVPWDTPGCAGGNCIVVAGLTSSVLNPQICLKLATSGDAVDIDFTQDEAPANCAGFCSTSPIETTAGAVARGAEYSFATYQSAQPMRSLRAYVTVAPNLRNLTGVLMSWTADGNNAVYLMKDAFSTTLDQNFGCHQFVGGVDNYSNNNQIAMPSASALLSVGCDVINNTQVTSFGRGWSTPFAVGPPGITASAANLILGRINGAGFEINGVIKGVAADMTPGVATGLTVFPSSGSPVAWMGDSIPLGTQAIPNRPPYALQRLLSNGKTVYNLGIGGHTAAQCLADWRDHVQGKGYATVVVHCGVNSLNASLSAAATMVDLTTLYNEIRASGAKLIIGNLLPWSAFATWNASKQTETLALNASIATYGSTFSVSVIDVYTALGTGTALNVAYDSGDGLHLNSAGASAYAALVQAANP